MPRCLATAIAALVVLAFTAPSAAYAAVVFGSDLDADFPPSTLATCFPSATQPCTDVAVSFHSGNLHPAEAPESGVITSVRYRSNTAEQGTLRLARRDQNGFATGAGTGLTFARDPSGDIEEVVVQPGLPVQAGDLLAADGTSTSAYNCAQSDGVHELYQPPLVDGAPPRAPTVPSPCTDGDGELLVQATIEPDADGDRLGDETQDNCPSDPDTTDTDGDGQGDACDSDDDNDGVADATDNCDTVSNPGQENTDGEPNGNACDPDDDNDGDPDTADNCPLIRNPSQADADGDGLGDFCDLTSDSSQVLPTAELGEVVVAQLVSGTVTIAVPSGSASAAGAHASQKGLNFVPLEDARAIPVGSFLNTRRGTVRLISARDTAGNTQSGEFTRGLFQVLQSRARRARGRTELRLKGSSFKRCRATRRGGSSASAAGLSRRTVRRLRANANGNFRTRGRHSAATVRGTVWITADRCDGTLTTVKRGRVAVRDFRRKRTVIVRAGKRYLAKAPS